MKTEKPLSEKIAEEGSGTWGFKEGFLDVEDVKEAFDNSIKEMEEEYLKENEFVNPIQILKKNFGEFK